MERNIVTIVTSISDLQLKQILVQEDHNIHTYSLFFVVLAVENSRKLLLFVTYRNLVFIFSFPNKKQKRKKKKFHTPFF